MNNARPRIGPGKVLPVPLAGRRLALHMRRLASLCTIALGVITSAAAVADGPYVSGAAGIALVPGLTDTPHDLVESLKDAGAVSGDAGEDGVTLRVRPKGDADWMFDVGFVAAGALGYAFGPARIDAEFSYLTANFVFPNETRRPNPRMTPSRRCR